MKKLLFVLGIMLFPVVSFAENIVTTYDDGNPATSTTYRVVGPGLDGDYLWTPIVANHIKGTPMDICCNVDGSYLLTVHSMAPAGFTLERQIASTTIEIEMSAKRIKLKADKSRWETKKANRAPEQPQRIDVWSQPGVYYYLFKEDQPDGTTITSASPLYYKDAAGSERLLLNYTKVGDGGRLIPVE